jgi:hypothetical protein
MQNQLLPLPWNKSNFFALLQQLVVKAVSLAIARDGASGGVVRTVIVRFISDSHSN